jgi:hypothetical protein
LSGALLSGEALSGEFPSSPPPAPNSNEGSEFVVKAAASSRRQILIE